MNINFAIDKEYEGKPLKELADAPVQIIAGVSASDAEQLKLIFGVKTVRDLANLKYVKWAQAVVTLAEMEQ